MDVPLDIEGRAERRIKPGSCRGLATEPLPHTLLAVIGDHRDHAGDRETVVRNGALAGVIAVAPVRIGHDRAATGFVERDALRTEIAARRQGRAAADDVVVAGRPLQHLESANRTTGDDHPFHTEVLNQATLRVHHVADRDQRKPHGVGADRVRVDRGRAGAALAAADDVRTDHEHFVGVDRLARADQWRPPPIVVAGVTVAGQGVNDENGIVAGIVQVSPGSVGEGDRRERTTEFEFEPAEFLEAKFSVVVSVHQPEMWCGGASPFIIENRLRHQSVSIMPGMIREAGGVWVVSQPTKNAVLRTQDGVSIAIPLSRRSLCRNWHLAVSQAAGLHRAVSLHLSG